MIELITMLKIDTGTTRRLRRYHGQRLPIFLRISGTPEQLTNFLAQIQGIPSNIGCRVSFDRGQHSSGVQIASAVSFPANDQFFESVCVVAAQLRGL